MSVVLEQKQGLIAGDGLLPVKMAQYAKENGFDVVAISLSSDNYKQLKKYCSKVYSFCPGEVQKIEEVLKNEEIKQITFLGKVSKTILIKRPKFDSRALDFIKKAIRLNDDKVMLMIIEELEKIGITILDQTLFIKNLMIPSGILGKVQPTQEQIDDFIAGYYNEGKQFEDGKMYTLPFSKSTEVLYYNKTFFDAHGLQLPKTWDDLDNFAKIGRAHV